MQNFIKSNKKQKGLLYLTRKKATNLTKIRDKIRRKFYYEPTYGQNLLFEVTDNFLSAKQKKTVLLINGYAGTGKTTAINAIIQVLPLLHYRFVLMAPTGRASKIMTQHTNQPASTIHKKIYKAVMDPDKGGFKFKRQKNFYRNTVFIIDEASMLNDEGENGGNGFFTDLIEFVFEHESNKLVLIGDNAQLLPIGKTYSPTLSKDYLSEHHELLVFDVELTEVLRQCPESGILINATILREQINLSAKNIMFSINGYRDINRITGENFEDTLRYAYDNYGIENTIIICRSNNMAVKYNEHIRQNLFFYENEVEVGDILMIVRNNYFYLNNDSSTCLLANGDFVEVTGIRDYEESYGFHFATLSLKLLDYPNQEIFEAKVILDTLHSMTPSLPLEDYRKLYREVNKEHQDIKSQRKRNEVVLSDFYLNALQIKYAYALTGHKSQGGQWDCVFVDHGFLTQEMVNSEFFHWLYTAISRTTRELYLVNFKATFFAE
jgi:ATP-dependent exoDNAse (exonuclease V) alpha subunit